MKMECTITHLGENYGKTTIKRGQAANAMARCCALLGGRLRPWVSDIDLIDQGYHRAHKIELVEGGVVSLDIGLARLCTKRDSQEEGGRLS
jgi:hypothetical protein